MFAVVVWPLLFAVTMIGADKLLRSEDRARRTRAFRTWVADETEAR